MTEKSRPDPDELLKQLQDREKKRTFRPIRLYDTPYRQEENRKFGEYLDTPEAEEKLGQVLEDFSPNPEQVIYEKARADLTPEEREALDTEEHIAHLKGLRGMSRKITSLEENLEEEGIDIIFKLYKADPELIVPIVTGIMKRPARLEKAQRNIQRIRKARGEG